MRFVMAAVLAIVLVGFAAPSAVSADPPSADPPKPEAPKADAAADAKAADASQELKLPPGWKKKKRGKFILYCKKEAPLGTRIKADTCYDEENMRNYILALEEGKADVDRIRSTCSSLCACGDPSAC
jgi:hypothetical protein